MRGMDNTEKYPLALRLLHWLMAALIIGLIIMGLVMSDLQRTDPLRGQLYSLHKSFGVTVLVLALLRLALRFKLGVPALPSIIPAKERFLAHWGHLGLYGFMFALPITGMLMSNSFGFPVAWFGVELPRIASVNKDAGHQFEELHETLAYVLMALLALHVAGALKHYFKEKTNLFRRML